MSGTATVVRGRWSAEHWYSPGDVVIHERQVWICVQPGYHWMIPGTASGAKSWELFSTRKQDSCGTP